MMDAPPPAPSPRPAPTAPIQTETAPPTCGALFAGFFSIGISGFGGVLPWARRMIVERRGWLSGPEFTDLLALCQFLPGPNIINLSVVLGARFRGLPGAFSAIGGLLAAPLVIVSLLGTVYARFQDDPVVARTIAAVAAAASGLVLAMALKIAWPLRRDPRAIPVAIIACVLLAFIHLSLLLTMAVTVPLGLLLARAPRVRGPGSPGS
jgi:chromate transporter